MSKEESEPIHLSEMIRSLRHEMTVAQVEGADSDIKMLVEDIEIELKVVVTRAGEVGGGVKFWVYNAEAKGSLADETTQSIKLKLKPISGTDGGPIPLSDTE